MAIVSTALLLRDAARTYQRPVRDWLWYDYVRAEKDVGAGTFALPGAHYTRNQLPKDGAFEIWTALPGLVPTIETETAWLMRRWQYKQIGQQWQWIVTCPDLNHLLKRRHVDYYATSTQAARGPAAADDMMKSVVDDNFLASATDATRQITTYLQKQASTAQGQTVTKAFSERLVLTILQELAAASFQMGTYLSFDVVCAYPDALPAYEFRTYPNQRGIDHRQGSDAPLNVGPDFGNMTDTVVDENAIEEVTRGIAGGQDVAAARTFVRANDTTRQAESPLNLIEDFTDATQDNDTNYYQAEADALVKAGRPKKTLTGKLVNTPGFQYRRHWNWGDRLTVQVNGESYDARVERVHVQRDRDGGEKITADIRGEN